MALEHDQYVRLIKVIKNLIDEAENVERSSHVEISEVTMHELREAAQPAFDDEDFQSRLKAEREAAALEKREDLDLQANARGAREKYENVWKGNFDPKAGAPE